MNGNGQRLYLVYGGELVDPQGEQFTDPEALDIRGIFNSYEEALKAWRAASFLAVDNAFIRYRIALLD